MVYNVMKLFMEINPALFDECTQEYVAMQEAAPQRALDRENMWKMIEETARRKQAEKANGVKNGRQGSPMEMDDLGQSERLGKLRLHDEGKKSVGVKG